MSVIAEKILSYASEQPEGVTLCAKELLHFGERAAVDQTLSRLLKRGQLLRVGRGLYASPVKTHFGERPPELEKVVDALAERSGETIVVNGAAAANAIGLTTQVPTRIVYLTSGPSRSLQLGKLTVELRHAPQWLLRAPKSRAGAALRALAWFGPDLAKEKIVALRKRLRKAEQAELFALCSQSPTWLARELCVFACHG